MRNKVVLVVLATVASAALVVLAVVLVLGGEPSFSDPAGAQCNAPPVTFGPTAVFPDHQEAEVHFTCAGAVLAGTLYLPTGVGPHPAVVWVHAAGKSRPTYGGPIVSAFLRSGLAIFSYDKRGVGRSQGQCCPGDYGHFNLLTADVVGAVTALRTRSDIDPKRIGLIGASQAGWIAPRAAVESHAAFIALASAGVLRYSLVNQYERFAGGEGSNRPRPPEDEIAKKIATIRPSGFDPTPYLEQLDVPALWLYGDADRNVPPRQSVALLRSLQRNQGKDCRVAGGDLTLRLPQIRA